MNANQLELAELKRAWIDQAVIDFNSAYSSGERFTAENIHAMTTKAPHPNFYGCLIARLRRTGKIKEVGRVRSNRVERNGAKQSLWETI